MRRETLLNFRRRQSRTRHVVFVAATALTASTACSNASSIPDFGAPRVDQILLFYPVGGLVRGRGLAGATPDGASHIFIKAHPNGSETIRAVENDGSFEFSILARGGNVLELSGATDRSGSNRGEAAFVKVPTGAFSDRDYVCCFENGAARGTCQTTDEREEQLQRTDGIFECPDPLTGRLQCSSDIECGFEEGEWLRVDLDRITVTPPDTGGFVRVSGFAEPRSLVTLQNRGLSGIGRPEQQLVLGRVSSDVGDFSFPAVAARGDDEIVLQVQDLNGIRSPAVSILVEDAPIAGFDVTGAFAWDRLQDGAVGTVAIQIAPYGIDGRGLCPNHGESPQTCFTGGVTHAMVQLENVRVDGNAGIASVATSTSIQIPDIMGADGDVRAGPLDVVLVIDRSVASQLSNLSTNEAAVSAVTTFLRGLRQRDRVGVVTYGPDTVRLGVAYNNTGQPTSDGLFSGTNRETLIFNVEDALRQPGSGPAELFDGVAEAAEMLRGSVNAGRIVVIAADEHTGSVEESELAFFEAFEKVDTANDPSRPEIRVDLIGISLTRSDKFQDLQSITAFTDGQYFDVSAVQTAGPGAPINQLELALTDIRSSLSGSFLLLYDITIPAGVGKAARLEFDARMNGVPTAVPYSGLLRVDLAAN